MRSLSKLLLKTLVPISLGAVAMCATANANDLPPPARVGMISHVVGDPLVSVRSQAGVFRQAQNQAPVFSGDRIATTLRQAVRLRFEDQSEIVVGPGSELTLEQVELGAPRRTVLELAYGLLYTWVRKTRGSDEVFAVKTRTGTMGVRGTQFITEWQQASQRAVVHTFEGRVGVAHELAGLGEPGQSVTVAAAQTSSIDASGRPLEPTSFDVAAYRSELRERQPLFDRAMQAGGGAGAAAGDGSGGGTGSGFPGYSLDYPNGLSPKPGKTGR